MKYILNVFVIIIISLGLSGFYYGDDVAENQNLMQEETTQIEIPDNVMALLDRSCLPCHGVEGSGKAKMKWNYEKMPEYSKTKLISKLVKVAGKVEDGKMPPPKKLKKHPDWKLSAEEKGLLISWAENAADKLSGGSE
jgi:mono/diheme cytochrome c family protein